MGFSEDDRIRHKNRHYNNAAEVYSQLRKTMADSDILALVDRQLKEGGGLGREVLLILRDYASKISENFN